MMSPRGKLSDVSHKPKDTKAVLLRLWRYLYKYKFLIIIALGLTLGANSLSLIGPVISGKAIDAMGMGRGHVDFPLVFQYFFLLIGFFALSSILSYLLSILMINISQKVIHRMRKDLFYKLSTLPGSS